MTPPEAHRCAKCEQRDNKILDAEAQYWESVLPGEVSPRIDQQAALANKWDKKYAEALAEGDEG